MVLSRRVPKGETLGFCMVTLQIDTDGRIQCDDANFYTRAEDYEECPPSSYEFIADTVGSYHELIDMAHSDVGAEGARDECHEALQNAIREWRDVPAHEKRAMHAQWLREKLRVLDSSICIMDQTKKRTIEESIELYLKDHSAELNRMKHEIIELEKILAEKMAAYEEKRRPLLELEHEMEKVLIPQRTRQRLLSAIEEERRLCQQFLE